MPSRSKFWVRFTCVANRSPRPEWNSSQFTSRSTLYIFIHLKELAKQSTQGSKGMKHVFAYRGTSSFIWRLVVFQFHHKNMQWVYWAALASPRQIEAFYWLSSLSSPPNWQNLQFLQIIFSEKIKTKPFSSHLFVSKCEAHRGRCHFVCPKMPQPAGLACGSTDATVADECHGAGSGRHSEGVGGFFTCGND